MSAQKYKHAPIVEAVLEFRFESEADASFLDEMARKLKHEFPKQEDQKKREFQLAITDSGSSSIGAKFDKTHEESVKRLVDSDGARVVLLSASAINVSRLPPYDSFDDLRGDAELVWDAAYKLTGVRKLKRIGLRYINRIDLQLDDEEKISFEEYLNLRINVPKKYETIGKYSLVFEFDIPEIECFAKVRSSVIDPALINHASFILDIDVFRLDELPLKKADVFKLICEMRQAKNDMFEEFITDKARAIFNAD